MAETGEKLENFVIRCLSCHKLNKNSETLLHVDWKKKYYMITCYTCNATEAFNEEAKKIKFGEKKDDDIDKDKGSGEKSGGGGLVVN